MTSPTTLIGEVGVETESLRPTIGKTLQSTPDSVGLSASNFRIYSSFQKVVSHVLEYRLNHVRPAVLPGTEQTRIRSRRTVAATRDNDTGKSDRREGANGRTH